ncbi:hypothetical protein N9157_00420 [Saprospiraceae bacterium]|nr:hypothetical protein [Saprospiraceae bacterium]MDB4539290.1 hypothetical protein [Saprospiraceae bacterium]
MRLTEKRQTRKEEMFELIDTQIESGLSQIQFCKKQQMSIATFSYWRQQYLSQKKENHPSSPNKFIPIKIKTPSQSNCPIEIQLPNKIILRCKDWSSRQLPTLISELQKIEFNPNSSC